MSVNGRAYDWEDITVTLPHGEAAGITEIKYEDGQEVTARYGRGSIPRSYGRGNYEASGSMVLDRDEWEKLKKELTVDGGAFMTMRRLPSWSPMPITIWARSRIP